jgi:hypothetical protein
MRQMQICQNCCVVAMFVFNKNRILVGTSRFIFLDAWLPYPSSHFLRRSLWRLARHRPNLNVNSVGTETGSCFSGTSHELFPITSFSPVFSRNQSSLNGRDSNNKTSTNPESENAGDSSNAASQLSDPPILTWFNAIIPSKFIPYARLARLDKPIGTMLLVRLLLQ